MARTYLAQVQTFPFIILITEKFKKLNDVIRRLNIKHDWVFDKNMSKHTTYLLPN
jgi:hypothetical protein